MSPLRYRRALGYRTADGCPAWPNVTREQLKPWIKATRKLLRRRIKQKDPAVLQLLVDFRAEIETYERIPFHRFGRSRPIEKAQTLIAGIIDQGKYEAADIVARGVAAILISEHGDIQRPPKLPYFRAIQVARAIRPLLRVPARVYEQENTRTGEIRTVKVWPSVRFRSRYACQYIEKAIRKYADWFIAEIGPEVVKKSMG